MIVKMKQRRGGKPEGSEGMMKMEKRLGSATIVFVPVHGTALYKDYQEVKI